jgi:hypothetical protein
VDPGLIVFKTNLIPPGIDIVPFYFFGTKACIPVMEKDDAPCDIPVLGGS